MRLLDNEKQPIIVALTEAGVPKTGLTVSITIYKASDQSDVSPSPKTLTEIGSGLYFLPANKLPDASDDVLCWKIDGSATLTDADRYKFGAIALGGYPDTLVTGQISIAGAVANIPGASGTTIVNHDYGGANNLQVVDNDSNPIEGAIGHVFLKSDYVAGNTSEDYVKGFFTTLVTGLWDRDIYLDPETYYVIVNKTLYEQVEPKEITIS